jgi:hypothetical protein
MSNTITSRLWTCRVYHFPLPASIPFITTHSSSMDVQRVSLSTASSIDLQGKTPSTASSMDVLAVSLSTASSKDVQCVCTPCHLWKVFFKCWNAGLSDIRSVITVMNKNADTETSPVLECFGTRLRYQMPECRCRRLWPQCRCLAMPIV